MQVELDDDPHELRRERELRRKRSGEGLKVGAFVVLEATGVENHYARFSAGKTRATIFALLLRAGSELPAMSPGDPLREDPYLSEILDAGGFKNYERAHLAALAKTLSPKLAHLLPPELVRKVVEHWLHAGFYPFTPAKVPTAPTVTDFVMV